MCDLDFLCYEKQYMRKATWMMGFILTHALRSFKLMSPGPTASGSVVKSHSPHGDWKAKKESMEDRLELRHI